MSEGIEHPTTVSNGYDAVSNAGPRDGVDRLAHMGGPLLTADQVAQMLGVPKTWVYEQSRKGRIPTVTLDRYRRYRAEAIARWIRTLEAGEGGG